VEAAPTVQGPAVSIGPAVEVEAVIWTARPRTGRVVIFLANVSKDFKAAALIAPVEAVEDLGVIDLVAGVIALAAVALAGLAGSAVAEEVFAVGDDEN
jgi:hypothetical protein